MNCSQIETLMLDYAAGRLAPGDRASAEGHFAVCEGCRRRAEGFRAVSAVLEDWETPEISPWFNARLRARIAEEESFEWNWKRAFAWLAQPAAVAAFAAVVAVGSLAVWTSRPDVNVVAPKQAISNPARPNPKVDELMPVVEDFDMLADFEVIQDMKTANTAKTAHDKM